MIQSKRPPVGTVLFLFLAAAIGLYFTFAALQGDFGLFHRAEIIEDGKILHAQLAILNVDVARMENLTLRLSDNYLDLDLLDQQAREILGLLRADEIVIR